MKQAVYTATPKAIEYRERTVDMEEFFVSEIKRIKGDLFRIANSILRNYADAEDALSEAITKAYAKRHTLKQRDKFKFWLMKILVRECYAVRRTGKRMVYTDTLPETTPAPETPAKELWDIVTGLPDEFRVVVVLYYYEDISTRNIAKLLHISEGTVKSRLYRARERLRNFIDAEGQLGGK